MAKYTFLLPAYKARFLAVMLRSIQEQTYTDFKVIISDDCSPERIHDICEPFLLDKRFAYRRNKQNLGRNSLVSHWNVLLGFCDTEYVILASDDDIYYPHFLERIDSLTNQYPNVDLYRARVERIDEKEELLIKEGRYDTYTDHIHFILQSYKNDFIPCISNYCYRTAVLKSIGGFTEYPLAWFSDDVTNFKMSIRGCANTDEILFKFRWSDLNITFSPPTSQSAKQKMEATQIYNNWFTSYLNELKRHSYEERKLFYYIESFHEEKMANMIKPYINYCDWTTFIHFCNAFKNGYGVDTKLMVYLYLRNKMKSLIAKIK